MLQRKKLYTHFPFSSLTDLFKGYILVKPTVNSYTTNCESRITQISKEYYYISVNQMQRLLLIHWEHIIT